MTLSDEMLRISSEEKRAGALRARAVAYDPCSAAGTRPSVEAP